LRIKWTDILLSVLGGVLTALSFPKFNLSFFAWISLIPILFVLARKTPKQSFIIGLIAGISFNAILIYWIPDVPAHYGNLSIGISLLIYAVFVLYLALFWAFFSLCFAKIRRIYPNLSFLLAPFLWIVFEYILTHFLTGFPWGLLGYSQYKNIWFLQLASITGIYGMSFILVLFQSLFVYSMIKKRRTPFFLGLFLVLIIHFLGWLSTENTLQGTGPFKASVIQGNVSSDIIWDQISDQQKWDLFQRHLDLSLNAYANDSGLIIWPEFTVPLCFSCPYGIYLEFKQRLFDFVDKTGCALLLGTIERSLSQQKIHYYNTALCLHPGLNMSKYYKMHLVPFGEYIPYKKIFFFTEKMTHAIGELTPGNEYILHEYQGKEFASPICYEIIFPNLVRNFTRKGAQFLVTITNDSWYGKSSAPYQHFAIAVIRAVENRRYLLRAATTGVSGIIDPYGRIIARSEMMTQTFLTATIVPLNKLTLYTRLGDFLPLISLTLGILFLILAIAIKKNERKRTPSE
jgi:apolipoprotein N-acyltransferase